MPWARASELDRVLVCPGSLVLPRVDVPSPKRDEAAAWGTMVHHWKATGLVEAVPGYPRHPGTFKKRLVAVDPKREELWPAPGDHELGVAVSALHHSVGSVQGTPTTVDAWKAVQPDDRVTGTLDYHGLILGNPWVDDLKTGVWLPSPRSAQLWLYGLAVFRLHLGAPDFITTSITHWPRYPATGAPERHWGKITRHELERFERVLKRKYQQLLELRSKWVDFGPTDFDSTPLKPGQDQCRFCPSKGTHRGCCPVPYTEQL
jgi:hypothetical protein